MNSLISKKEEVLLHDIKSKMTKEKFENIVETIFRYEDIYSRENDSKNCSRLEVKHGLTRDEAFFLMRHARENDKVAADIQSTGKHTLAVGLAFILVGVVLIYLTAQLGFIVRLFVILRLIGVAGILHGILWILISNFSFFRRKWVDAILPVFLTGLLITGLVGFIYYLMFM